MMARHGGVRDTVTRHSDSRDTVTHVSRRHDTVVHVTRCTSAFAQAITVHLLDATAKYRHRIGPARDVTA